MVSAFAGIQMLFAALRWGLWFLFYGIAFFLVYQKRAAAPRAMSFVAAGLGINLFALFLTIGQDVAYRLLVSAHWTSSLGVAMSGLGFLATLCYLIGWGLVVWGALSERAPRA